METVAELNARKSGARGRVSSSCDRDLVIARRLDWRYLLPDPNLRSVGYVGQREELLLEALEQLSEAATVVGENAADGGEAFDVVVLKASGREDVERACSRLSADGHLYWEVEGGLGRPSVRRCMAWLRQLGFERVQVNWNRPNFEQCTEIIPLDGRAALGFVLGRRFSGGLRRMAQAAGHWLAKTGAPRRVMPCVSILARKQARNGEHRSAAETYLRDNWKRLEPGEDGPPKEVSTIVATPAFRASRHAIFLMMADGAPELRWVAKTPRLAGETKSLDREVENLRAVQGVRPGGFDSAPRVLAYEAQWGSQVLLESAVGGTTMRPAIVRRRPKQCAEAGVRWLGELHQASALRRHDTEQSYARLIGRPLDAFERVFPVTKGETQLIGETRKLVSPLERMDVPLVFEHGDFSAPNLLIDADGGMGVVDWELAEPRGLPAVDLFFFLSYLAFARSRANRLEEYLSAFAKAFFGANAWAPEYVARYQERMRLPAASLKPLFIACWCRYVTNFLARLNDLGGGPRETPAAETAEWLRGNRYFSMWRYAVEHADQIRLGE